MNTVERSGAGGMKVVVFGGTGLIGGGVLLEALDSPEVAEVVSVSRRASGVQHPKLREVLHGDFADLTPIAGELSGVDACFWCLGISSFGMDEAAYTRITYDFTMSGAEVLLQQSPDVAFCFVSGAGADDTEAGRAMWARVKGRTENALRELSFRRLAVFRPGLIRQTRGTKPVGLLKTLVAPLSWVFYGLARAFGGAVTNTEIGQAMLAVASGRCDAARLDSRDIVSAAAA